MAWKPTGRYSRRSVMAAGFAVVAAGIAGCTKAAKSLMGSSPAMPSAAAPGTAPAVVLPAGPAGTASVTSSSPTSVSAGDAYTASTVISPGSDDSPIASAADSSQGTPTGTTSSWVPGSPAVEIANGLRGKPQVALTFHGQGDVGMARRLLSAAASRNAKVTVMAVGTWLSDNPDMASEILAGGHELGNHTWSHADIESLSEDDMIAEVVRCRDLLARLTGTGGLYFRPSQAQHSTDQMLRIAGAAGYGTCLSYDIDSLDYTDPGAEAVRQNAAMAQGGSVVSMHFGHQDTIDALPVVLDDLAARGLQAVTVSTLLA